MKSVFFLFFVLVTMVLVGHINASNLEVTTSHHHDVFALAYHIEITISWWDLSTYSADQYNGLCSDRSVAGYDQVPVGSTSCPACAPYTSAGQDCPLPPSMQIPDKSGKCSLPFFGCPALLKQQPTLKKVKVFTKHTTCMDSPQSVPDANEAFILPDSARWPNSADNATWEARMLAMCKPSGNQAGMHVFYHVGCDASSNMSNNRTLPTNIPFGVQMQEGSNVYQYAEMFECKIVEVGV